MNDPSHALDSLRDAGWNRLYPENEVRITVGLGTCGISAGAQTVFDRMSKKVAEMGLQADVVPVGCAGMCFAEPVVTVSIPGWPRAVYANVDEQTCDAILTSLDSGRYSKMKRMGFVYRDWMDAFDSFIELVDDEGDDGSVALEEREPDDIQRLAFNSHQVKRLSSSWGRICPWSIEEYVAEGGYSALKQACLEMDSAAIIDEVDASGLRGRGGAGFPTGEKWRSVLVQDDEERYVIANADEGDPGAYMDRALMESDPHKLIEGMAIAARALGAEYGFIFTRSEYPCAIRNVESALKEARDAGILGNDVFGSGWRFDIEIVRSAGAYVCGEEGALLEALEGRRPDPRRKPPYPSQRGFHGHPTCISNVETYANVPSIILHGAQRFRNVGTELSPGTKIFSLAGTIERVGLIEVPMGITLNEVVGEIAGKGKENLNNIVFPEDSFLGKDLDSLSRLNVQVGGPSGAILPMALGDLHLDYEGLLEAGGIMGSGGIVVFGRRTCVVDTIRYFLEFSAQASCGKCHACRNLLAAAAGIVGKICEGHGTLADLKELERLAEEIPRNSRCGLGRMAVNPLASGLRYFKDDFIAHINGSCPNLVCKQLMHFEVVEKECPGCLCCLPSCPTNAIKGQFGKPFVIDQDKCTKCWMCVSQCPYPALMAFPEPCTEKRENAAAENAEPVIKRGDSPYDRCLFCNRCIDACRNEGAGILYFDGRGKERELAKATMDGSSLCLDCDACAKACPLGLIDLVF